MILEVLSYPNKKLYEISKEVEVFDEKLHKLLDDMYETMIAKEGIGLAAIQIGVAKRIFIINLANEEGVQDKENLIEIINPKFELREGECVYQRAALACLATTRTLNEVRSLLSNFKTALAKSRP